MSTKYRFLSVTELLNLNPLKAGICLISEEYKYISAGEKELLDFEVIE